MSKSKSYVTYSDEQLNQLAEMSQNDQMMFIYNKLNEDRQIKKEDLQVLSKDSTSEYFGSICYQYKVNLNARERELFEMAAHKGDAQQWAKNNGFIVNHDIPTLIKSNLKPHVSFKKFKSTWDAAQQHFIIVDPSEKFLETDKTWLDHLSSLVNSSDFFRIGDQ